jgi:signal transduction histidine kinase/ActR/RegA family two-component response regulator
MIRKIRSRALRRRILLFVVTSLLVMGGVIGVVATRPLAAELEASLRRELGHGLDLTAVAVGEFARSARSLALQVTSRTRIRETLEEYLAGRIDEAALRSFTEPKLRDAMALSEHAVGVTRLDPQGTPVARVGERVPARFLTTTETAEIVDAPELGGTSPRFVVRAPIFGPRRNLVGTDVVLFDAQPLLNLVSREAAEDSRHEVVALFTNGALRASTAGGFVVAAESDWRWNFEREEATYDRPGWVTASAEVQDAPWSVAISLPEEAVFASAHRQVVRVLLTIAAVMLAGIVGTGLLVRPLAGGIVLRAEELEAEVDAKTRELQDELARRTAAESNLAESNTRLRDTNAELERAVKEAQEQRLAAEQANHAKTAFLGNMSHDLRTPLQGILGFLSLLTETVETTEEQKYLRYAEESAGDLLRHVDELLEISRIESGGVKLLDQEFSVRKSVQSLMETLRPDALRKSLSLSAHVTSAVPEQLRSDAGRIRQITSNLLTNAIKYTHAGWVYAHVDYAPRGGDRGTLMISVQDTGPGIPESQIEHIFDRFARLDYTVNAPGGAGLGLTITKTIVTMMGGSITCESTLGEGSVFRVSLPVSAAPSFRLERASTDGPAYGEPQRDSLRVILAEDDRMNQVLLSHLIRRLGHEVTVATNGREAIDLLEERHYDLIFMDVQMPVMNGLDATLAIREATDQWYADIPIIGMTAYADLVEQQKFLAAGMNVCITKPVDDADLRSAIREVEREPSHRA